jgi:hypothetical protein
MDIGESPPFRNIEIQIFRRWGSFYIISTGAVYGTGIYSMTMRFINSQRVTNI